ncbi:MAG: aldehyde ferredoxin oxidoreductase family protein [Planctomycetota bacterium]|nr:aldehyde ferredoxin oxidoreductase family protein [Planctomycetota bacterium]
MNGFIGKILVADLNQKTFKILEKDDAFYRKHLGGALLCAVLYEELTEPDKEIDPFGPENPIIFATGPLAGENICGVTRVNVLTKGPESTGIYLSQAGGEFGPCIKRAGYDALAIVGKSKEPTLLDINNGHITFMDANDLWGMDRVEVHELLTEKMGKNSCIASIGSAGENLVHHANIMFEPEHYAGRGGMGAVLGAKKVKAVVVRGDHKMMFHDPGQVKTINKKGAAAFSNILKESPASFMGVLRRLGTYGLLELNRAGGNLPVRNFNEASTENPEALKLYDHETAEAEIIGKAIPCKGCYVACKKKSKLNSREVPPRTGTIRRENLAQTQQLSATKNSTHGSLAEYESIALLGPNIGLEGDIHTSLEACELCNQLGLDTISTGNMIAWLMDCFESGVLSEDKMGYSIKFGESEKVIGLIQDIALRRTDLGNMLADGIHKASESLGKDTEPFLRFANGVGIPAHMPRKKPGIGFGYLHGPNPGDHMKQEHDWIACDPHSLETLNLTVTSAPYDLDQAKIEIIKVTQSYYGLVDSLSLCMFIFGPGNIYSFEEITAMVNAATGFDLTFEELMLVGERTVQLQRKLYVNHGGVDEELLPFMETEIPEGPSKGLRITKNDFEIARKHYYKIMGWDKQGRPTRETLQQLNLE